LCAQRVLVTGATGFIGRNLIPELANQTEAFALVRPGTDESIAGSLSKSAKVLVGDVTKYEHVGNALKRERIDVVIHLAALVQRPGTKPASEHSYVQTNVQGTLNICEASLEAGVKRLVHMSTAGVHGRGFPGQLMDENSPYAPTTVYERSKAAADRLVLDYAKRGLETIALRPPLVYGDPHSKFFKWLFSYAANRFIPVFGDGLCLKHFVHVTDVSQATLLAMNNGRPGRAYIIADETPVSIDNLLMMVGTILGRKGRLIHFPLQRRFALKLSESLSWGLGDPISWFLNNRAYRVDAMRNELNYRPRMHLQTGLAELLEIMRKAHVIQR